MGRVVATNEVRAKALESYSSVRSYHLECHCLSHKKADMVVRTDYQAPNKKEFTIVSAEWLWHGAGPCVQETPGSGTGVDAG